MACLKTYFQHKDLYQPLMELSRNNEHLIVFSLEVVHFPCQSTNIPKQFLNQNLDDSSIDTICGNIKEYFKQKKVNSAHVYIHIDSFVEKPEMDIFQVLYIIKSLQQTIQFPQVYLYKSEYLNSPFIDLQIKEKLKLNESIIRDNMNEYFQDKTF
jgi:hypothetical protein